MKERFETMAALAAAAFFCAAGARAQVAGGAVPPPAPGHVVVADGKPQRAQGMTLALLLPQAEFKRYLSLLEEAVLAGNDDRRVGLDRDELGVQRGTISADQGLWVTVTITRPAGAAGGDRLTGYLLHMDRNGVALVYQIVDDYAPSCPAAQDCKPVSEQRTQLQAFESGEALARIRDFWAQVGTATALFDNAKKEAAK